MDQKKQSEDAKNLYPPMSLEQLAVGIHVVIENARGIVQDCEQLFQNGSFARCFALSISALEEVGKIFVLFKMANITHRTQKLWKVFWKEFRDHETKSAVGLLESMIDHFEKDMDRVFTYAFLQRLSSRTIEEFRQAGLYVNYDTVKEEWLNPGTTPKEVAELFLQRARESITRCVRLRDMGFYNVRVLKLKQDIYGVHQEELSNLQLTPEKLIELIEKVKPIHREFFSKVRELGIEVDEQDLSL